MYSFVIDSSQIALDQSGLLFLLISNESPGCDGCVLLVISLGAWLSRPFWQDSVRKPQRVQIYTLLGFVSLLSWGGCRSPVGTSLIFLLVWYLVTGIKPWSISQNDAFLGAKRTVCLEQTPSFNKIFSPRVRVRLPFFLTFCVYL